MSATVSSSPNLAVKSETVQKQSTGLRPKSTDVLAISFWYPPKTEPRAVQVSRLLKHLNISTVLVCADLESASDHSAGLGDMTSFLRDRVRVPYERGTWRGIVDRVASQVHLPLWATTPDPLVSWKSKAVSSVDRYIQQNSYRPSVMITFAYPLVDHLIGLRLKRRYGFPWLAHFSDPWVDSPFRRDDRLTRAINASMERHVISAADRIVFTSEETAALVMEKYDEKARSKVKVVPHSFEPKLFPPGPPPANDRLTIRYLGDLYLERSSKPLLLALQKLAESKPELLSHFHFEIVGSADNLRLDDENLSRLPKDLISIRPKVSYVESLSLMSSADGLMVIDAPAVNGRKSVFLPSKLIEYIGAGRPIIGLTPPGTAADLIRRLEGWIADPADPEAIVAELQRFLSYLLDHRGQTGWGVQSVRENFEAPMVARKFEEIINELA